MQTISNLLKIWPVLTTNMKYDVSLEERTPRLNPISSSHHLLLLNHTTNMSFNVLEIRKSFFFSNSLTDHNIFSINCSQQLIVIQVDQILNIRNKGSRLKQWCPCATIKNAYLITNQTHCAMPILFTVIHFRHTITSINFTKHTFF